MSWLSRRRNAEFRCVGRNEGHLAAVVIHHWSASRGTSSSTLPARHLGTSKHKKLSGGGFLLESPGKISSSGFVLKFATRWEQKRRCHCCVFISFLTHPSVSCLWFCLTFKGPLQPKLFCDSVIHELFLLSAPFCTQEENHSVGGVVPVALQQGCGPV